MRYPLNQMCLPIPAALQPFLDLDGSWSTDGWDWYCRRRNGSVDQWTPGQLNAIDRRLYPLLQFSKLEYRGLESIARLLSYSIQCWHDAITLDLPEVCNERHYLKQVTDILTNPKDAGLASITVRAYIPCKPGNTEALAQKVPRTDQVVEAVRTLGLLTTWDELESAWPGIRQQVLCCEQLGLSRYEAALHVFATPVQTTPEAPELPEFGD